MTTASSLYNLKYLSEDVGLNFSKLSVVSLPLTSSCQPPFGKTLLLSCFGIRLGAPNDSHS